MRAVLFFLLILFCSFQAPEAASDTTQDKVSEEYLQEGTAPRPLQFDRDKIASLKEDPDFNYTEVVEQENWWTRFKRYLSLLWQNFLQWLFGDYRGNSLVLFLVELIPYLILASLLAFVTWLFMRLNPAASILQTPQAGKITFTEEEEIVQSRDISQLIKEAVASENYRLAIRFYYLLILQKLSEAGFIKYQFPKTNEEYLAEIGQEDLRKQFRQITRIYDFIWYGSFEVTEENFNRAERDFKAMQKLIKIQDEQKL